eukprot:jgi/Mesvir1/23282/Mv20984-RA.1
MQPSCRLNPGGSSVMSGSAQLVLRGLFLRHALWVRAFPGDLRLPMLTPQRLRRATLTAQSPQLQPDIDPKTVLVRCMEFLRFKQLPPCGVLRNASPATLQAGYPRRCNAHLRDELAGCLQHLCFRRAPDGFRETLREAGGLAACLALVKRIVTDEGMMAGNGAGGAAGGASHHHGSRHQRARRGSGSRRRGGNARRGSSGGGDADGGSQLRAALHALRSLLKGLSGGAVDELVLKGKALVPLFAILGTVGGMDGGGAGGGRKAGGGCWGGACRGGSGVASTSDGLACMRGSGGVDL